MAQVSPPAYLYNQTANQQSLKKTEIISRKKPQAAQEAAAILAGQKSTIDGGKYSRNLIQTLYSQELAIGTAIGGVTSSITGDIQGAGTSFASTLQGASSTITEAMKPVSTALGSVLGTLTGIAKDPLGSITLLPQTLSDLVGKVNPGFAARMEATFKKYKVENFAHLPQQIMGSIKNLVTAVDAIIALPLAILQDLYQGLMEIMEAISDLVDQIINTVMEFFMDLLNAIIPLDAILEFIAAVSELASEIGGIAGIFLGSNPITQFANSVQAYAGQLGGFLANPLNTAFAFLPPQVSQGLYVIRNPQQLINNILPQGLSQEFAKLSQITGFGFNGNMGFGFESVLNGLQGGVISSILNNFASQYSILTPLVGLATPSAPATTPNLTPAGANLSQATTQGVVQLQTMPPKVLRAEAVNSGAIPVARATAVNPGAIPIRRATPVTPTGVAAGTPSRAAIITGTS